MKSKILNIAAAIALSLVSATSAQADDKTTNSNTVRNVVLVHGAFADGSGWRGVYNNLTARGYNVTIVQNPLTSLADDVAATKRALDRQDGPTVLVGHSWGGTVITEAGTDPKVAALVYVAALAPDAGETTGQLYEGYTTPPEFVLDIHTDGYAFVEPEMFKQGFANDVSDADAAFMRDSQVPINLRHLKPNFKTLPGEQNRAGLSMEPRTRHSIPKCWPRWPNGSTPRSPRFPPVILFS